MPTIKQIAQLPPALRRLALAGLALILPLPLALALPLPLAAGLLAFGLGQAQAGDGMPALRAHLEQACDFTATPWCRLPGAASDSYITEIEALMASRGDPEARDRLWGWGGPKETFGAWGSAAFDGTRFYFFGGGHHHYRGNDLKVYDLAKLRWSRLYDPAYVTERTHPAGDRRYTPEVGPRATHVYDGLTYDPVTNALYLFGHANFHAWRFDLDVWARTRDPWQAWQSFPFPAREQGRGFGFYRTEATGDGQILVHGGVAARGRGAMFVLDTRTRTYRATAQEIFRVSALTAAGDAVYGMYAKGGSLVRYDHLGRAFERFAMPPGFTGEASAYHPGRGLLTFWDGGPETLVFDTQNATWHQVGLPGDRPAPQGRKNGVWGGWAYVAAHDVFVGLGTDADGTPAIWAYRLPDPLPSEHPLKAKRIAEGYSCSDEVIGWGCPNLQAQVDAGAVAKGVYRQCARVRGPVDFGGAWLKDTVCGGKAALIVHDGAILANVRISDITTRANAACVRWEGGSVVIKSLSCRASDMGLLGNGTRLVIEDSEITQTNAGGRSLGHLVYTCARRAAGAELIVRNSRITDPGSDGHVLKSGCARTRVENSTLAGGAGPYSRIVDAFNGGALEIVDTQIVVGATGGNGDVIGYGAEGRANHPVNTVTLIGGRLDCRSDGRVFHTLHLWPDGVAPSAVRIEPAASLRCPPVVSGPMRRETVQ